MRMNRTASVRPDQRQTVDHRAAGGGVQTPHGEQAQSDDDDGDHEEDGERQHRLERHRRSTISDRHSSMERHHGDHQRDGGCIAEPRRDGRIGGGGGAGGLVRMVSRSPASWSSRPSSEKY